LAAAGAELTTQTQAKEVAVPAILAVAVLAILAVAVLVTLAVAVLVTLAVAVLVTLAVAILGIPARVEHLRENWAIRG